MEERLLESLGTYFVDHNLHKKYGWTFEEFIEKMEKRGVEIVREIKFRAWNKKLNFMDSAWLLDFEHELVCHSNHNHSDMEDCVLMQYTGLKDKNGIEIYEGDIVQISYNNPLLKNITIDLYKIETDKSSLIKMLHSSGLERWHRYLYLQHKEVEVIGNIYENGELLNET